MINRVATEWSWRKLGLGLALALAAPSGWLLIRMLAGHSPLATVSSQTGLLVYMALFTAITFASIARRSEVREERHRLHRRHLDTLVVTDPMTRLKNVRYFRARLYEEYAKALRSRQPLSVAIVDLDHFKVVNDSFGHPVGDQVLIAAAKAIESVVRRGETAARVGGEEFALLLPGSGAVDARIVAERVRKAIQRVIVPKPEDTSDIIAITASVGLASTEATGFRGPEVLYGAADEALLRAKRNGRDQVAVNDRPSSAPSLRLLA